MVPACTVEMGEATTAPHMGAADEDDFATDAASAALAGPTRCIPRNPFSWMGALRRIGATPIDRPTDRVEHRLLLFACHECEFWDIFELRARILFAPVITRIKD